MPLYLIEIAAEMWCDNEDEARREADEIKDLIEELPWIEEVQTSIQTAPGYVIPAAVRPDGWSDEDGMTNAERGMFK